MDKHNVVCFNRNKLYLVSIPSLIIVVVITLLLFKYLSKRYKWKY